MMLFIGFDAINLKKNFISHIFSTDIDYIDWYEERKTRPRFELKNIILAHVEGGKYSEIVIMLNQDPLFYEDELIFMKKYSKLIGVFTDDTHTPNYALQIAYYFDLILTTDPSQLSRYQSIGVPAKLHLIDVNPDVYRFSGVEKTIDILLYGSSLKNRTEKIRQLKKDFNQLNIVDVLDEGIAKTELVRLLNHSKLTINWASVSQYPILNNYKDPLTPHYLQFKGRLIESALLGCICVSDHIPEKLKNAALLFKTYDELKNIICKLVHNDEYFKIVSNKLRESLR